MKRRIAALGGVVIVLALAVRGLDATRREYDFTADSTLSLTDVSRDVLAAVDDRVHITAFLRRSEPGRAEAAALLSRYARANSRVVGRVLDPADAPGETRRLGVDPVLGGIAVERGARIERGPTASEQDVTSALARVMRDRAPKACFTQGHGERSIADRDHTGLSGFAALLTANGYGVDEIDLATSRVIPTECEVVIVAGPLDPLGLDTVAAFTERLDLGGRALVLADPESKVDVSGLTAGMGLSAERGLVVERNERGHVPGDPVTPLVASYRSGFPFVRRLAPTFYPGAQAVRVDGTLAEGVAASLVAVTTTGAFLDREPADLQFDPGDEAGPVGLVAASDRSLVADGQVVRSRVVLAGDVDFASNAFVNELGNSRLLAQAVDWLALQEDLVSVSANLPRARPLVLTSARVTYARVLGALIIPLAFLVAGALVWTLRRGR